MRIVFAGTPDFAAVALTALIDHGVEIALVLTQPDRPAGRGQKTVASPVKALAVARGLSVMQPPTLREPATRDVLAGVEADVWVVAAYGLILPPAILELPRLGCINIHASLLPRWRGAAPIQRAILAGDRETGISIMQMDAGLDTGAVLMRASTPIGEDDTARTLHDRLAVMGGALICSAFDRLEAGTLQGTPQPADGVTYAAKITRQDGLIDWTSSAAQIARQIRAFDPVPGAYTSHAGAQIKIWRARAVPGDGALPGTVIDASPQGITISCGEGALSVAELQRPGGRRLPADAFLRGSPLPAGTRFETSAS
jgi:methionyl-tRNA formyltransferase